MSELLRKDLLNGYLNTFGQLPKYGAYLVETAEESLSHFKRHGLAPFYIPLSGSPEIFIFDLSLLRGAKFAWIQNMRVERIKILISDGRQSPNTRRIKTTPERATKRSIEFDASITEGLSLITRYSARLRSSRMPPYSAELYAIPHS